MSYKEWNEYILKIAFHRNWDEIIQNFVKHLSEMAGIIKTGETKTIPNKINFLINLTAIAITKIGGKFDLNEISFTSLLERLEMHEIKLKKEKESKSNQIAYEIKKIHEKVLPLYDDDDT